VVRRRTGRRRKRKTRTWSSVKCVRTAANCFAATTVRRRTTSSVFSRPSRRFQTVAGTALAARYFQSHQPVCFLWSGTYLLWFYTHMKITFSGFHRAYALQSWCMSRRRVYVFAPGPPVAWVRLLLWPLRIKLSSLVYLHQSCKIPRRRKICTQAYKKLEKVCTLK